jgi:hypothetical protein
METQINVVTERDGPDAALAYAKQCLRIYRECARNHNHFAHGNSFRPHYVRSILFLKKYIKACESK